MPELKDARGRSVLVERRAIGKRPARDAATPEPLTSRVLAERLRGLATRVRHLTVSHTRPERFHEERSEIQADLSNLAKEVERCS